MLNSSQLLSLLLTVFICGYMTLTYAERIPPNSVVLGLRRK